MEVAGGRDSGWISLYLKSMLLSEVLATSSAAPSAKSLQSCPTLWDPRDDSPPGSPIPGILQARTLEWIATAFSNAWKWKVKVKLLSHVWLLATPWTAACQAPSSMGFPRQEYWSGVPLSSPQWNVSHKKEWNKAICHKKSGTKDYHTKSDKEGPTSYGITYMWNLRKWYKWSYLQNTNRLTDLENELWSVGAEGRNRAGGRIVRKFVIALCTLPHLKWITSKDPLYSKGNSAQYYITT